MTDQEVASLTLLATVANLQVNLDILSIVKQSLEVSKQNLQTMRELLEKINDRTL